MQVFNRCSSRTGMVFGRWFCPGGLVSRKGEEGM